MSSITLTLNIISRWLNYVLAIPITLFGSIGAALTILVFIRHPSFRRNSTITYLLVGAIISVVHLPLIYFQTVLINGFNLGIYNTNDVICRIRNYLFYVTTVSAASFPCWATFDQYASTRRQAKFRHRWNSMHVVRLASLGTILFWGIVYFPMLVVSESINGACILTNKGYQIFNSYILTPMVFIFGPFTLITAFTLGTIRNLRLTAFSHRHDRLTKQIRRMLIPQLIILAICGIPFGIECIYIDATAHVKKSDLQNAIEHLITEIMRLFYHVTFVSTFYIYLYMSNDMRSALMKSFRKNRITPTPAITLPTLRSSYQ